MGLLNIVSEWLNSGGAQSEQAEQFLQKSRILACLPPNASDLEFLGHGWIQFRVLCGDRVRKFLARLYIDESSVYRVEALQELIP